MMMMMSFVENYSCFVGAQKYNSDEHMGLLRASEAQVPRAL